jgi:hypothetical protein
MQSDYFFSHKRIAGNTIHLDVITSCELPANTFIGSFVTARETQNARMTMDTESERTWKEAIVANLKYFPGRDVEIHVKVNSDDVFPDRGLNPDLP